MCRDGVFKLTWMGKNHGRDTSCVFWIVSLISGRDPLKWIRLFFSEREVCENNRICSIRKWYFCLIQVCKIASLKCYQTASQVPQEGLSAANQDSDNILEGMGEESESLKRPRKLEQLLFLLLGDLLQELFWFHFGLESSSCRVYCYMFLCLGYRWLIQSQSGH